MFERQQDAVAAVSSDALWLRADNSSAGRSRTRRKSRSMGAGIVDWISPRRRPITGRWGDLHLEEALYRDVGVRNGPTITPIELRVGIIKG
ncbi:MAG: hypothetical protein F9K40_01865 [Kofleriaceae bacterium]|nr:MAG: hypothetical protein F9K40_01865 [Kofleriaceae bacterium]